MSNGDHLKRPDTRLIKAVYDRLYHSGTTLSRIKDNVLGGRFLNQTQNQSQNVIAVPGRSIVWKTFLLNTEPLKPEEFLPLESIRSARHAYREAMLDKMRAPDGSYEEHFVVPGSYEAPARESYRQPSSRDLVTNNPLSLDIQNPWTDWFTALELRKTILQDVERTFPDIDYFRHSGVQYQLTNILYLYSIMHAHIGYRQGMHELLAPIYYAVDYDSVSAAPREDGNDNDGGNRTYLNRESIEDYSDGARDFLEMCDRAWVSADAYALFDAVMAGAGRWYEWRENPAAASTFTGAGGGAAGGSISSSSASTPISSAFASHVNMNVAEGQVNPTKYVAPIVQTCGQIQSTFLKSVDPVLAHALQRSGIEPQIYGIRWLRLLFTREFPLADAMLLWDGLFACDTSLDLVPWICVAMLVRIRNQLIHGDYSAKLTCLLHYPPLPGTSHESDSDSENGGKDKDDGLLPYHITLLLRQALAFQMAPTPSTGSSIVSENRNMLGIPLEVAAPASSGAASLGGPGRQSPHPHQHHHQQQRPDPARRLHLGSASSVTTPEGRALMLESGGGASHARNQSSASIPEMLARGLLDRGESLGINKTVMSAYSEFKKNFPDLASSLVRSPTPSDTLSSFPLSVERPIEEHPPWEPRPRLEVESELAELRKRDRLLGQSVSRIVDVLLLQDSTAAAAAAAAAGTRNGRDDGESTRRQRELQERKREALENLAYVRDLLMGGQVGETDEERLFGEEEARRRKRERQKQQQSTGASSESKSSTSRSTVEAPSIPKPSASVTSAPHHSTSFPRKMTSHPLSPGPTAGANANAPRHSSSSGGGMTPTEQSPWQQTDRDRPPLSTSSSSSKLRDMAPWNRTPSNFGTNDQGSTVVPMALPQLPPRTSSTLHTTSTTHRPPAAGTRTSSSAAGNNSLKKKTDQPPPVQQDPLGVL